MAFGLVSRTAARCSNVPPIRHEEAPMARQIDRRDFLRSLGVGAGVTLGAAAGSIPLIGVVQAQDKPKGNIPSTPYRIGHMTFFTGPAAVLGEPLFKGQGVAAEGINAAGGLLGQRKSEV